MSNVQKRLGPATEILLTQKQIESELPPICMCCGAPATVWSEKSLLDSLSSFQGGATPMGTITRTMAARSNAAVYRLRAPFCTRHSHYWLLHWMLLYGFFIGMGILLLLCVIISVLVEVKTNSKRGYYVLLIPAFCTLVWIFVGAPIVGRTIRVRETGRPGLILLHNAHPLFVAALTAASQTQHPTDAPRQNE